MNKKFTRYFSWNEVWGGHPEDPTLTINLLLVFTKLDVIREFLGHPIIVTSAYRPAAYNKKIGGSPKSAHIEGKAVDFQCPKFGTADDIRKAISPHLEFLGVRCEDLPGSNWVHIDTKGKGFFKP